MFERRPKVTRYKSKKTYAGRSVKRTTVVRRNIKSLKSKKLKSFRPTRGR